MTKEQLIEALKEFPDDMKIMYSTKDDIHGIYKICTRIFLGTEYIHIYLN